jgi:hypothetical protein
VSGKTGSGIIIPPLNPIELSFFGFNINLIIAPLAIMNANGTIRPVLKQR